MRRVQGLRPSPATVLAALALFAALAGSVYAATKVDTRDLVRGAVTAKKLAPGAVTSKAIAPNAVQTQQIADGAVTGAKVDENSLGKVSSATNADNAANAGNAATVGGLRLQKFASKQTTSTALTSIATLGTLDLRAGCDASGHVLLEVRPASGAAAQVTRFSLHTDPAATGGGGQGTLSATGLTILAGTENSASKDGTVESDTLNGAVTTIQWAARDANNFIPTANPEPDKCFVFGTSISG
jgi:hypothetical protein